MLHPLWSAPAERSGDGAFPDLAAIPKAVTRFMDCRARGNKILLVSAEILRFLSENRDFGTALPGHTRSFLAPNTLGFH
jgi:hypothetical protein